MGYRLMASAKPEVQSPVIRTSAGLRDAIFDELDAIRSGHSNPARANTVARLASSIVETVQMELEVQRHLKALPDQINDNAPSGPLGAPLKLSA